MVPLPLVAELYPHMTPWLWSRLEVREGDEQGFGDVI